MTFSREQQVGELLEMLAYCRPAGSRTERKFIARFITPLGTKHDKAGNLILRIGDAPVLWSCHTDTVHLKGGQQKLRARKGMVTAVNNNCLGADDTAGVWLMCQMIRARKEGLYVFHRGEECGGIGSTHISRRTPELLKGIDYAIAFDRKGVSDIITHQWGGRCCSDAFATALGEELGLGMKPSDLGSFTDTANYTDDISECTNIAVGYYGQHSAGELQDVDHLVKLLPALLALDVNSLPVVRKPGEWDTKDYPTAVTTRDWSRSYYFDTENELTGQPFVKTSLTELVQNHPEEAADLMREYGISAEDLAEAIYQRSGFVHY